MIKAVFFDLDDTLSDHRACEREALMHVFDGIGVPYGEAVQDAFRPLDHLLWNTGMHKGQPVPTGEIPTYRFKVLFEALGIERADYHKANELFKAGLGGATALVDGAEEAVKKLHASGYILCVITNGLTALQAPRIANSKIGKYISHILVSEEIGAHKPSPLIFTAMLDRLGLSPHEAVMVGDRLDTDIQGAINAGIPSLWYNPAGNKNQTAIIPSHEITRLSQVAEILKTPRY
jgi:YjjG family noncanonical pyrimidine nucleotidase